MSNSTYIYPPISSDPGTLYNGFVTYMQSQIPGWKPYSGELDDWLGRAFTYIGSQLMEIQSDVATSIFRYFGAYVMGYPPNDATAAIGSVTITVQDTVGYTIPAFTTFSFPDASGNLQGFEITNAAVIAPGTSSTTVNAVAMIPGGAGNGCAGAGSLSSSTPITFITALSMAASSNGGTDAESDTAYLSRLASLMTTVTPSPITATNFSVIAQTQPSVGRAFTLGAFNPANWTTTGNTTSGSASISNIASTANIPVGAPISGAGIPAGAFVHSITNSTTIVISANATATATSVTLTIGGATNQGGYVTTWVADVNGVPLGSGTMNTIQSTIQALCLAGVSYAVLAPTTTALTIVANVVAWPNANVNTATVQSSVQSALQTFLSPANFAQLGIQQSTAWSGENTIRLVVLESVCMTINGVHYVSSITINGSAADLVMAGVVPLPAANPTITVNVTTG